MRYGTPQRKPMSQQWDTPVPYFPQTRDKATSMTPPARLPGFIPKKTFMERWHEYRQLAEAQRFAEAQPAPVPMSPIPSTPSASAENSPVQLPPEPSGWDNWLHPFIGMPSPDTPEAAGDFGSRSRQGGVRLLL